jgi:hypothetical protein
MRMPHQLSRRIPRGVFLALLVAAPLYAGKNYKISSYGNGHQIWFEAEDFDERNPDEADYAPVVDMDGAFGKAVGRTGASGGMMRWTFDISAAGGKGGTWYFWGRVLNPNNRSDFMLIEGDPGDMPFPRGRPSPVAAPRRSLSRTMTGSLKRPEPSGTGSMPAMRKAIPKSFKTA